MFALAPEEDIETLFTRRNYDGSLMITEEVMAWLDYNLACAVIGSLNVVDVVRAARELYHTKLQVYRGRAKPIPRKVGPRNAPTWREDLKRVLSDYRDAHGLSAGAGRGGDAVSGPTGGGMVDLY